MVYIYIKHHPELELWNLGKRRGGNE